MPAERRAAMTWAQRLKRVFGVDIETCPACGGAVRIIASIEDSVVIEKILARLAANGAAVEISRLPPYRAPPRRGLFDEAGLPDDHCPGLIRQRDNGSGWLDGRRTQETCASAPAIGSIRAQGY